MPSLYERQVQGFRKDIRKWVDEYIQEGKEEGKEEGERNSIKKVVKNLIDNNSHIDINEYKFTAPSIEGYYTFNVISMWYDKGDINYKFTINVKNKE